MLRHVDEPEATVQGHDEALRVLLPLDGSAYADRALALAEELALGWNGCVTKSEVADARRYLDEVADWLPGTMETKAVLGDDVVDTLADLVRSEEVTDACRGLVCSSAFRHGRDHTDRHVRHGLRSALRRFLP